MPLIDLTGMTDRITEEQREKWRESCGLGETGMRERIERRMLQFYDSIPPQRV